MRSGTRASNAAISNGPITYELDGLQYVIVGAGDTLGAFVMNQVNVLRARAVLRATCRARAIPTSNPSPESEPESRVPNPSPNPSREPIPDPESRVRI